MEKTSAGKLFLSLLITVLILLVLTGCEKAVQETTTQVIPVQQQAEQETQVRQEVEIQEEQTEQTEQEE